MESALTIAIIGLALVFVFLNGIHDPSNKVRWNVAGDIATTWLTTIPATALVAAGLFRVITQSIH